ncbi:MAG: sulfate adenylyltransferase subunit CysN [Rhizobiaceae bacterium]
MTYHDSKASDPLAGYLAGQQRKSLLRFLTCGSVDDGKSTLIGRLLHDTRQIFDDQLAKLEQDSRRHGTAGKDLDFALLVDGLEAEREQGITIDVAYRFFATPKRKFIVADTPGHEQYTRNMATGASTADLAIVLVDARKGVLTQTRRHSHIASLLGIRHIVLAVNKIDLAGYSQEVFDAIVSDYMAFAGELGFASIYAIPVSARHGDNIAARSPNTPWHEGPALLDYLDGLDVDDAPESAPFRFPVQWVNRPNGDFRGYAGTVASGAVSVGDLVAVAASCEQARIISILAGKDEITSAVAGQAVTLVLDRDIDISRGELLSRPHQRPDYSAELTAGIVWFGARPAQAGQAFLLRTENAQVNAIISGFDHAVDVNTLVHSPASSLPMNGIGQARISLQAPLAFDPYNVNRVTGAFVLIDKMTNATLGAGMIGANPGRHVTTQPLAVSRDERAAMKAQKPAVLWFTGLSGSGKSTIANLVEKRLHAAGRHTILLDGDNLRQGLNRDLGFSEAARTENIRRVAEVARLMTDAGLVVLVSFISPFRADRALARSLLPEGEFLEIFVDAPLEECMRRDPKGLYAKALNGEIRNFTGVDSPYEAPESPDLRLAAAGRTADSLASEVESLLVRRALIPDWNVDAWSI